MCLDSAQFGRELFVLLSKLGSAFTPRWCLWRLWAQPRLSATILHAVEASIWALAYKCLGALPNYRIALLFSLNSITSYGHANLTLEEHLRLMGALEALNGWLLFGLTTAFLFAVIEKVWSVDSNTK